jgi:hypothetical protein
MMNAGSINRVNKRTREDQLLQELILGHDQSNLDRFINAPYNWKAINSLCVQELQKNPITKTLEDGLVILDDVVVKSTGRRWRI